MKNLFAVLASAALLGGCSTLQSLNVNQATIDKIQQTAVSVCGFLPAIETIAGILSGGASLGVTDVANAICTAVTARTPSVAAPGTPAVAPMVRGVSVKGVFIR